MVLVGAGGAGAADVVLGASFSGTVGAGAGVGSGAGSGAVDVVVGVSFLGTAGAIAGVGSGVFSSFSGTAGAAVETAPLVFVPDGSSFFGTAGASVEFSAGTGAEAPFVLFAATAGSDVLGSAFCE